MTSAKTELGKIKAFIEGLDLASPGLENPSEDLNRAYRRFHGLLIFDLVVERSSIQGALKDYSREALSDASSSLFLTLVGLYKPGRLCLRSSVENVLRFFVGLHGADPGDIATVYQLFGTARDHAPEGGPKRPLIDKLHNKYAELCKTSHSAHVDYMSLDVPFEKLVKYSSTRLAGNLKLLDSVFTASVQLLYTELHPVIGYVDTQNADFLRDLMPKTLKKALSE